MSFAVSPTGLIAGILSIVNSPLIVALVVLAVTALLCVVFSLMIFITSFSLVYLWSAYENGNSIPPLGAEYEEETILTALMIGLTTFATALAALLNMAVSAATSVAQAILNNLLFFFVFILIFALVILWDTWHNVIIQAAAPVYTCFVAPIVRVLILPFTNLVSFAIQVVLPVTNSIREVVNEVTLDAIIRAVICGFGAVVESLKLVSQSLSEFLFALIAWFGTSGDATTSILDVGPNFAPAAKTFGFALFQLSTVFTCACQRIDDFDVGANIITPIFAPFNSSEFANAINASLALIPVFLTQGIARPIVRSVQNVKNAGPGTSILSAISRPSLNSTFDTASAALNQTGAVLTDVEYIIFNLTIGIARGVLSECPSITGFAVHAQCSSTASTPGFCNGTASGGCVIQNFIDSTGAPVAHTCGTSACDVGTTTATACACSDCLCSYNQLITNPDGTQSIGTNVFVSTCGTNTIDATTCQFPIPGFDTVTPPKFGIFAAALDGVDSMYIQTFRYIFNILVNLDGVFTSTDGFLLFRYTNGITVFNNGVEAIINEINFIGQLVVAAGDLVAAEVQGDLVDHPVVRDALLRKRAIGEVITYRLIRAQVSASTAIQKAFGFIGQVIFIIGDLLRDVVLFLERFIFTEQFDTLIGTIYFSVKSAISSSNHIPNPFAFAQFRFGDAAHGITYVCGFFRSSDNTFIELIEMSINNDTARSCDESVELLNYCRFVFQRIEAGTNTSADALAFNPAYISQSLLDTSIITDVNDCLSINVQCTPTVQPVLTGDPNQALELSLAVNDYNTTLQSLVQITHDLDLVVTFFAPDIPALQTVISGFFEPLVSLVLPIIDLVVHIPNLFHTSYLACIDVEGALRAFNSFVENITNILAAINEGVTGTPCITGVNARDSRILCTLSQFINSAVDMVVSLGIEIWRFTQLLIHLLDGSEPGAAVSNFITFDRVFLDVGTIVFDLFAVLTLVIPRDILCSNTPTINTNNGCCFAFDVTTGCCGINPGLGGGAPVCVEGQTQGQCNAIQANFTGFVQEETFNIGQSCASSTPFCDLGCCVIRNNNFNPPTSQCSENITAFICDISGSGAFNANLTSIFTSGVSCFNADPVTCATSDPTFVPTPQSNSTAPICIPNVSKAQCSDPNSPFFSPFAVFAQGQSCGTFQPSFCTDNKNPVQQELATDLAIVATDVIVLLPKITLDVVTVLINDLSGSQPLNVFGDLIDATARPSLVVVVDVFTALGNILGCFGAGSAAQAFLTTASVIKTIIDVGLSTLEGLVEFVVFFVGGLFELLTVGTTTLLQLSLTTLAQVIYKLLVAILGQGFICGGAEFICALSFGAFHPPADFINACTAANFTFHICKAATRKRSIFEELRLENNTVVENQAPMTDQVVSVMKTLLTEPVPLDEWESYTYDTYEALAKSDAMRHGETVRKRFESSGTFGDTSFKIGETGTWMPSDQFCGAYLATYGFERAMNDYNSATSRNFADLSIGARCFAYSIAPKTSLHEQIKAAVDDTLKSYYHPMIAQARQLTFAAGQHWSELAAEAIEQAKHIQTYGARNPHPKRVKFAEEVRLHRAQQLRRHGGSQKMARKAVYEKYGDVIIRDSVVQLMAAGVILRDSVPRDFEAVVGRIKSIKAYYKSGQAYIDNPRHKTKQQLLADATTATTLSTIAEQRALGFALIADMASQKTNQLGIKLMEKAKRFISLFGEHDSDAHTYRRTTLSAQDSSITTARLVQSQREMIQNMRKSGVLKNYRLQFNQRQVTLQRVRGGQYSALAVVNGSTLISNDTLTSLGLFSCNPSTDVLCTGCSFLDSGVDTIVLAADTIRDYFTNNDTGFFHELAVFEFNNQVTLLDPLGSDVYTTQNKTTPSILDGLLNIRWPWLWNYTTFNNILSGATNATLPHSLQTFVGQTQQLQLQRAAAANRTDIDNQIYALLAPVVNPLVRFGEEGVAAAESSQTFSVIINLFNTYIACDYQGALVCNSPIGIGLYDGLFVTLGLMFVTLTVFGVVAPGMTPFAARFFSFAFIFILLWISYGSSPLCTIQSFFTRMIAMLISTRLGRMSPVGTGGIRGIPACFPVDANTLLMDAFPQCPFIPPSLIDPRDLAEASTTKCAACGTAPRLLPCATAVQFLNGFDVVFYLSQVEFGPVVNQQISTIFAPVLPDIANLAALYTPEYVASLGQAGRDCALILSPDILTASAEFSFEVAVVLAITALILGFLVLVLWASCATIWSNNGIFLQMERGFIYGTTVRRLTFQRPRRSPEQKNK